MKQVVSILVRSLSTPPIEQLISSFTFIGTAVPMNFSLLSPITLLLISSLPKFSFTAISILLLRSAIKLSLKAYSLSLICEATTSIMAFFSLVWTSRISVFVLSLISFISVLKAESRPISCLCNSSLVMRFFSLCFRSSSFLLLQFYRFWRFSVPCRESSILPKEESTFDCIFFVTAYNFSTLNSIFSLLSVLISNFQILAARSWMAFLYSKCGCESFLMGSWYQLPWKGVMGKEQLVDRWLNLSCGAGLTLLILASLLQSRPMLEVRMGMNWGTIPLCAMPRERSYCQLNDFDFMGKNSNEPTIIINQIA